MSYAIASGTAFQGITLIGPFEHQEDARGYATGTGINAPLLGNWEIIEMQPATSDDINSTWQKSDAISAEDASKVFDS